MLSKCDAVVLRRKRFSDFEIVDPTIKEDADQIYIAGYYETAEGEKKNVKLSSTLLFKNKVGEAIPALAKDTEHGVVTLSEEEYNEEPVNLVTVNYASEVDFLQVNNISEDMYSEIAGKKYLCFKLSEKTPLGYCYRIYLPNFPFEHGVLLFPNTAVPISEDEPVEVFYNVKEDENDTQTANDFYFTLIHLADPKSIGEEELTMKTKVIRVLNIESEE